MMGVRFLTVELESYRKARGECYKNPGDERLWWKISMNSYRLIYIYMFTYWNIFGCVCVCVYVCVCVCVYSASHVRLFVNLWSIARQAPPSIGFSGLQYCSGLSFPPPGDLLYPEIECESPASSVWQLSSFTT